ncbi:unnamed protein product, partial [Didymodactylos carnosus]
APSIQANPILVYNSIGKQGNLRCIAEAPPDTTITWKKIDDSSLNIIDQHSTRFWQSQHGHSDTFHATLNIKDIQQEDFGFYVCIAESVAGRSNSTVELKEHRRASSTRRTIRLNSILSTSDHLLGETLFVNNNSFSFQSTNFIISTQNNKIGDFMLQQQHHHKQKLSSYYNQTRMPLLKRNQQQNKVHEETISSWSDTMSFEKRTHRNKKFLTKKSISFKFLYGR